jgi:hypothetical protein
MHCTPLPRWHKDCAIRAVEDGYEVAVKAEQPDPFDNLAFARSVPPVAFVRVNRPERGPANTGLL